MADIKTRVQNIDPNLQARDLHDMSHHASNIYEAISIIEKRARQLNVDIKDELHGKLQEFAITTDTIEEIQENKEQIEISKFYERLPNPTLIATHEYVNDELEFSYRKKNTDQDF